VGPFKKSVQFKLGEDGNFEKINDGEATSYRDVALLGDIDTSVISIVKKMGWEEAFKALSQ